jgi:hypothetical protein
MDSEDELKEAKQDRGTQEVKSSGNESVKDPVKAESAGVKSTSGGVIDSSAKKGSSNAALIIVIIIVVLLILGVGGWFGIKYLVKNYSGKLTTATATKTASAVSGSVSVKTIFEKLMYPGATIGDQKQDKDSAYKAEMTLNAPDTVANIRAHYTKLVTDNSWKITRQGSSGDDNYYLTVTDNVFVAEIDITKYTGYDTTDIDIDLSGDKLVADGIYIPSTSTTAVATLSKTSNTPTSSNDYIISDSSTRIISRSELTSLTPWRLKVARNEIYARHGREFVHKDLQCYFAGKSWYKADANFSESSLSSTETKNVATIKAYEDETSSPLASSDSGCNTNQ